MIPIIRTSATSSSPDNSCIVLTTPRGSCISLPSGRWSSGISLAWHILKTISPQSWEPIMMSIPLSAIQRNEPSWRVLRLALTWKLLGWSQPKVISSVSGLLTSLAMDVHLPLPIHESPSYWIEHELLGKTFGYLIGGGFTTRVSLSTRKYRFGIPASLESCSTQTHQTTSFTSLVNSRAPRFEVTGKLGRTIAIESSRWSASTLMRLFG